MKKRLLILSSLVVLLVLSFALSGCMQPKEVGIQTEVIDKSTRLNTQTFAGEDGNYTVGQLEYVKDGKMYPVYFDVNMRKALDWLHANSKPGEKIFSWWDNGHMIRGYAKREPIIYTPCYEIISTVSKGRWDANKLGPLSSKEDVTNIAYGLLADSPTITKGIMKRYGARYAFVARTDMNKIGGMVTLMGEDMKNYLDELNEPKEGVRQKVLFKMGDGWPVKGFNKVYEDGYAYIYEIAE
jgi:asparagine N-glycosylation enzyme membrane subunit Stt3